MQYRQGDVFIEAVEADLSSAIEEQRDEQRRIVLAYGEATGHAHAIHDEHVKIFGSEGARYLMASESFNLVHEEHNRIRIPAGTYRVTQQVEYSPEKIHTVMD